MKRPIVKFQKTSESFTGDYTNWLENNRSTPMDNPDQLEYNDANTLYGTGRKPALAELIIEQFTDASGNFPILSAKENLVLKLYLQNLSITEVAKELKLRKQTVASYLKRCGKKLRKLTKAFSF